MNDNIPEPTLKELIEELSQNIADKKTDKNGQVEPNFDGKENHFARLRAYWNHRKRHPEATISRLHENSEIIYFEAENERLIA